MVPALLEAVRGRKGKKSKVSSDYFYGLLFTRSNLKLVHIVCHDKGCHTGAVCDKRKYYCK